MSGLATAGWESALAPEAEPRLQVTLEVAGQPDIRFHDLRHTAATLMLLADTSLYVVWRRLGHASMVLTGNTYAHVLPSQGREIADGMEAILGQFTTSVCVMQSRSMIRLALIASSVVVLVGCGAPAPAPPQTTYTPVPPEKVHTFPPGSRSVVVEFVTAEGYGLGSDPPGSPTLTGDAFTVYSDDTVEFRPSNDEIIRGSGDFRRRSVKLPPTEAREIQQILVDPQRDQLLSYYHTPEHCDDPDCGNNRWHLIIDGGKRVQSDGTGPPVLRQMVHRLSGVRVAYWKAYGRAKGTPIP